MQISIQDLILFSLCIINDADHDQSVDYSPRDGAVCPVCGAKKMPITCSKPWQDDVKVRFHKCKNVRCILSHMGASIKSIQVNE